MTVIPDHTDLSYPDGVVRVYHPDSPFAGTVDFLPRQAFPDGWMDLGLEDLENILDLYEDLREKELSR